MVLNGHNAYSYSCLTKMDGGLVGLAWETVLPGSGVPKVRQFDFNPILIRFNSI